MLAKNDAKKIDEAFYTLRVEVGKLAEIACDQRDVYGVHFAVSQSFALDRMERALKRRFQGHD